MNASAQYRELYARFGRAYRIDPRLIEAVVRQESSGKATAFRFEPHLQDASYGLMQVLGKTARLTGSLPPEARDAALCVPDMGVRAGVMVLSDNLNGYSPATQQARTRGDYETLAPPVPFEIMVALARYNGGWRGNPDKDGKTLRNADYVKGVLSHFTDVCREIEGIA